MVTLDIPVASRPALSVEMRKSLTLRYTLCPGVKVLKLQPNMTLQPSIQPASLLDGFIISPSLKRTLWHTGAEVKANEASLGVMGILEQREFISVFQSTFHLLKENQELCIQGRDLSAQKCSSIPNTYRSLQSIA